LGFILVLTTTIFATAMKDVGVKIEYEVFDTGMITTVNRWLKKA